MNNNDTTLLLLVGAAVLLIGFLLLLPPIESADVPEAIPEEMALPVAPQPTKTIATTLSVNAGLDRVVQERETFRLAGQGDDAGGLAVTYLWTAQGGLGTFENPRSPTSAYTAPSTCGCEARVILTLTVTNTQGDRASDQMVVTVRNPLACPSSFAPSGGVCYPVGVQTAQTEIATCPATPDVACDSPCITHVPVPDGCPPAVPCPGTIAGVDSEAWLAMGPIPGAPLHPRDRPTPSIDRHYPAVIDEGSHVALRASVRNPSCQAACFVWSVSKGRLEDADTLTPIYHAPASDRIDGETVTITLTVVDPSGGRSYDQIRIKIRNTDAL